MSLRNLFVATFAILLCTLLTAKSALGSESSDPLWKQLLQSANELSGQRKLDSAYAIARAAVDEAVRAYGPIDTSVAMTLHRLAGIAMELRLSETDSLLVTTLDVWRNCPDANPLEQAKTLANYGLSLFNKSRFAEAESIYVLCLETREKYLPPAHLDIARILLKLGECKLYQSKPAESRDYCQKAIDICLQLPKRPDGQLALAYHGISLSAYILGAFVNAEAASRKAIEYATAAKLVDLQMTSMSQLISVYLSMNRLSAADSLSLIALALSGYPDKIPSDARDRIALDNLLNSRGQILWQAHRFVEAESCYVRSLDLKISNKSNESEIVRTKYNLANLYRDWGRYADAEPIYREILKKRRDLHEGAHRDVAFSLESYARLLALNDRKQAAFDSAAVACEIRREIIRSENTLMSEKELLEASQNLRASASLCLSIAFQSKGLLESRKSALADIMLRTKGFVSDFAFSRSNSNLAITEQTGILQSVKASLEPGTAVIEYYLYIRENLGSDSSEASTSPFLAALVVTGNSDPAIYDLGNADKIDSLMTQYRDHFQLVSAQGHLPTKSQQDEFSAIANQLHKAVTVPFKGMADGSSLIVAPDGMLNLLSFATLTDHKGNYLVEKYSIHYLSAGRDLLRDKRVQVMGSLLAIGNPDFDAIPEDRFNPPQAAAVGTAVVRTASGARGTDFDCDQMRNFHVQQLPYTQNEIASVESAWKKSGKSDAQILSGSNASEDRFKRKASLASVIYLATHGFYFGNDCDTNESGSSGSRSISDPRLLQTGGLLLAGANLNGQGAIEAGVEDGIMTTSEIAELDLRNTGLVVLSACETGLGKIESGEGVYGLRRAFLLAGAKTVVSTLWKIDDANTADMMSGIFADQRSSISERIRSAQLAQIKRLRGSGLNDHPYSWGAFVATGALR